MYGSLHLDFKEVPEGVALSVSAQLEHVSSEDLTVALQACCRALDISCREASMRLLFADHVCECNQISNEQYQEYGEEEE